MFELNLWTLMRICDCTHGHNLNLWEKAKHVSGEREALWFGWYYGGE